MPVIVEAVRHIELEARRSRQHHAAILHDGKTRLHGKGVQRGRLGPGLALVPAEALAVLGAGVETENAHQPAVRQRVTTDAGWRQLLGAIVPFRLFDSEGHIVGGVVPRRSRSVAGHLGIPRGALLLYLWQVDYTDEGVAVLSSHEYHLADAFEFTVLRRGPGGEAP